MDTSHHDQTASVQRAFARDVRSLVTVIQELGNPFEEMSLVLDTKEIASPSVVKTVNTAEQIGQEQFNAFVKECLVDRTKPIHDTIHHNNFCSTLLSPRQQN